MHTAEVMDFQHSGEIWRDFPSHDLIRVSCRTPHQMTLANALCRAWEERG